MRTTDAELHRKILMELESEFSLRDQDIGLAVRGGVVTLSGCVDGHGLKQAAERAVARVAGVRALAQELRLRAPAGRPPIDTEIAHAVTDYLRKCSREKLRAKVEQGWVTLEGEVELFARKWMVEEGVGRLRGVRGVTNSISVSPPELVHDITAKVEAALTQRVHIARPSRERKRKHAT